jgi:dynein assembly factor 1
MSDFDEEEEEGMTKKAILASCREHHLYVIPDINDVLYLHYGGYLQIKNLEEYTGLKALWLNNNQISVIENISHLQQLTSLYLQSNMISEITGLDALVNLDTLSLSNNYLTKIRGLQNLRKLRSLEVDHNRLNTVEGLQGLLECPSIQILNLTYNLISDEAVLDVLAGLPDLRVLRIDSNPIAPKMRNYRRVLIQKLTHLTYLDDTPVGPNDRRLAAAWDEGGRTAEMDERRQIRKEKREIEERDLKALRKLQREKLIRDGGDLHDYPELMSSDDEDKPHRIVEVPSE